MPYRYLDLEKRLILIIAKSHTFIC